MIPWIDSIAVFTNPFPSPEDAFGVSVTTARDDLVLIGAPNDGTGALNAGAAYLFETNGALLVALTNPAPANGGYFGVPVAAAGRDRILVGKQLSSEGVVVIGAAFLYDLQQLVPPLAIARNAANVAVRWPGPTGSFVLQNSSQLGTAASWSDVAELVITQAPTNILTQPLTNTNRFYRLRFR